MSHAPLPLAADRSLRLHIFLDRSVIEIFAEGSGGKTVAYSSRIYPTRPDSLGLQLFAQNGTVTAGALEVWRMGDIWHSGA